MWATCAKCPAGARKSQPGAPVNATTRQWPGGTTTRGRPSKRAQAQQQSICLRDESGFSPLPSVVRTDAPIGQTPMVLEWWTRAHLSAVSATSPEGKVYCHGQDGALNSADVIAFLERLPAYAPELHPDEGLWQQLTGVERRNQCCCNLLHLRRELRAAVKRVRRTPRLINSFCRGAKL
jgi:hypothetical protein